MEFSALRGAMRSYFNRGYDAASLLGFAENTPIIHTHLLKFYTTLFMVAMSSALGSFLGFASYNEFLFAAHFIVAYSMFTEFLRIPPLPQNEAKRIHLFVYGSFFAWACLTPLLAWLLGVDEGFVVRLLVGVCVSFGYFQLAFKHPYPLASVYFKVLALIVITSAAGADDSAGKNIFWLHLGFSLYVVAYSQEVVLRVRGGDGDFVAHAVHLYTHFISFLVNLIRGIWNMRRNQERDE